MALTTYLPSGEMAALTDLPVLVICVMVKFWKGIAALPRSMEKTP
jgi:hypothetical protein